MPKKYADNRGYHTAQRGGNSPAHPAQLIAYEYCYIHRKDPGGRLSDSEKVEKIVLSHPIVTFYNVALDERNHCVTATDSKKTYLGEGCK